jgi:ribosomal protein L29
MAIIKAKDVSKMSFKERQEKIRELKVELVKANVTANRTNAKTKEIKRAISRLLTFNKTSKGEELNKHK